MNRLSIIIIGLVLIFTNTTFAQDRGNTVIQVPPTNIDETISAGNYDIAQVQANQAFMALMNRQFQMALQQYTTIASSNPEYQKMVEFCQNILDRLMEVFDEYMDTFGRMSSPDFRLEDLTEKEINKMLNFQLRQNQAGQSFGELGLIADIPISDLGLYFDGSDQTSLAEYLGWVRPRSANERVWYRARKRAAKRQLVYSKMEIKIQQRQERFQRMEEFRRRKLDRQSGNFGGFSGGSMGGDFGGMMSGMGSGMMSGRMSGIGGFGGNIMMGGMVGF